MSEYNTFTHIGKDLYENFSYTDPSGLPIRSEKKSYPDGFAGYRGDCHWHNEIEVLEVYAGSMDCYVNGKMYTLRRGEGIVINSDRMHYSVIGGGARCEYSLFQFDSSIIGYDPIIKSKYIDPVISRNSADAIVIHLGSENLDILSGFRQAMKECTDADTGYELAVCSVLSAVWLKIFRYMRAKTDISVPAVNIDSLKNMIEYIRENYSDKVTLENIARAGLVSRTTCHNMFREYLNCSPVNFLIEYRIRKSLDMLENRSVSITEVSQNCGFSSSCYYAETFKKIMKCTPRQWREKHIQSVKN